MKESNIHFRSLDHQRRFLAAMQDTGKIEDDGRLDPEYAAALFILTSSSSTWEKASGYISRDGIDFEDLLNEVDFSGAYSMLIHLAWSLFNSHSGLEPQPAPDISELYRLDSDNFNLALSALQMRRQSWPLEAFRL